MSFLSSHNQRTQLVMDMSLSCKTINTSGSENWLVEPTHKSIVKIYLWIIILPGFSCSCQKLMVKLKPNNLYSLCFVIKIKVRLRAIWTKDRCALKKIHHLSPHLLHQDGLQSSSRLTKARFRIQIKLLTPSFPRPGDIISLFFHLFGGINSRSQFWILS